MAEKKKKRNVIAKMLSMESHIHNARRVMEHFFNPLLLKDKQIPLKVLKSARGIAFLTQVKAGFVFTGIVGSGIIIHRIKESDTWSGPVALGSGGMGWGAQIGGEKTDVVLILNTPGAVKAFAGTAQVKMGADISVAAGPVGRSASADVRAGDKGVAACYSYSHSQGLFAGLALEGAILFTRTEENELFYGIKGVKPMAIFRGEVAVPPNDDLTFIYQRLHDIHNQNDIDEKSPRPQFGLPGSRTTVVTTQYVPPSGNPQSGIPPGGTPGLYGGSQTFGAPPGDPSGVNYGRSQSFATPPGGNYGGTPQFAITPVGGNYGGDQQGNYGGNPQGNYGGNPQGNYGGNPQGNFGGNPQGNFGGNSQGNFGGNPQFGAPYGQMGNPVPTPFSVAQPPSVPAHPQARGMWDFTGQDSTELSFHSGDQLSIISQDGEWWTAEKNGVRGLIPANYVQLI